MVARSLLTSIKLGSPKPDQLEISGIPPSCMWQKHITWIILVKQGDQSVCKVIWRAWVLPHGIKGHPAVLKSSKSKHLEKISPVLPKPGNLLPQEGDEANSQKQQMFISQSLILRSSQNPSDQVLLELFIRQSGNLFAAQDLRKWEKKVTHTRSLTFVAVSSWQYGSKWILTSFCPWKT